MVEVKLRTPVSEGEVRRLKVGDIVYLDGVVVTWRDRAYERAFELLERGESIPQVFMGAVHWHCGPIVKRVHGGWIVVSAGSTTSSRFTFQESRAIREWGVRLVIGKGGMGGEAADAMRECGAAYLETVGGAASLYAKRVRGVESVYWLDLGVPEAVWVLRVEALGPLLVTMDSSGGNLRRDVMSAVEKNRLREHEIL
ncbi:MAG: FumA C-terminus/TtdB family hydratase beta subunit [Candidatus Freyarchaeota archaeon]|nr:FumA C-terminus/TtdB family hydratase beta subunit [Candidatus Freyrarchaeum guaymaensis]